MSILVLTSDTLIGTPATGNIEYSGQFYGTDSNNARAQMQRITQSTAVASTSGTSIDFTALPAWIKRITVMFSGVSTSGTSTYMLQLGTGSTTFTTTGYNAGVVSTAGGGLATTATTTGLPVYPSGQASDAIYGAVVITNMTGNTWVLQGVVNSPGTVRSGIPAGQIALAAQLTAVRLTTVNGTDTFDAGSINILYEG